MWLSLLTFLGGIMVLGGEVLGWRSINESSRWFKVASRVPSSLRHHKTLTVTGGLLVLLCALLGTRQEAAYQAKIETLSEDTRNFLSGGDSFVFISFHHYDNKSFTGRIEHRGKYPVYDVTIRTLDMASSDGIAGWTKARTLRYAPRLSQFAVVTESMRAFLSAPLEPTGPHATYGFLIETRNGSFLQQTRLVKLESTWVQATRVVSHPDQTIILVQQIDPAFPRNQYGQVEWRSMPSDLLTVRFD